MPLECEIRDQVAILTLSTPGARNAWSDELKKAMVERLDELETNREVRCVIITGDDAQGAFSAGANVKGANAHSVRSPGEFLEELPNWKRAAVNVIADFPKPIVAAVNGYAIGVGCIITFCADLVVASEKAEWRMPQAKLGIAPAYGAWLRLVRLVGKGHAMRMAMGFPIDAAEAYRIGLAQWLVPHAGLMDKAMSVAKEIAALPPLAAQLNKESLLRGMDMGRVADASLVDTYRLMALELTEDKTEAHAALRERRPGKYRGR